HLLAEAVALYPEDYRASLTLGNLLVQRGDRQGAIRAYSLSRLHAPEGEGLTPVLSKQLALLHRRSADVKPLSTQWIPHRSD
ncbi:MAG: hypothetical protein RL701_4011, partial [Pseudomonadota bacterium]